MTTFADDDEPPTLDSNIDDDRVDGNNGGGTDEGFPEDDDEGIVKEDLSKYSLAGDIYYKTIWKPRLDAK